ncbi:flavin reductase family protein [Streptomyces flavotricini]|uniref:Flavin reductase family protein n=1 Tax=Streptomyces flavotricini TaxID=66888 RepID=A0ABS8E9D2_9ACTN|nr:flavin reductase family protein [Streptomyces flavotricini]MCC0097534.1 flavin reductase family protein [Streptomyces flavotricini]
MAIRQLDKPAPEAYRASARQWPTGVAVLTTLDGDDRPHGTTINSLTTIALDPALLLISLRATSRSVAHILRTRSFALSVLAHDQTEEARHYAAPNRAQGAGSPLGEQSRPGPLTGCALLHRACAHFECALDSMQTVADHCLVIGSVLACSAQDTTPLVFSQGMFTSPGAARTASIG